MSLSPLPPVMAAGVTDTRLSYEWDEWDVHEHFDFPSEALEQKLANVSGRGSIALMLAVGEWICERYRRLNLDPAPEEYFEAGWAEQMRPNTAWYIEIEDDEWRGIVRGPLAVAMTIANDALFCLDEDPNVPTRAAWMTNLARHVLPRAEAFEQWLATVSERLVVHHPAEKAAAESLAGDSFGLGRPVARELFDTTQPFDPSVESALIERFLAEVDQRNQFLLVNAPNEEEDE